MLIEGTTISSWPGLSPSARYASFSQASSTSPICRRTNVIVDPRAPESSTGTFLNSSLTNCLAVASVPPGWRSA